MNGKGKMKRRIREAMFLFVFAAVFMICFSGCGADPAKETDDGAMQIVVTIFPEYDWVREILGENPGGAEVTWLLDAGVDLHSFQPTPKDMVKIAGCDLFIYVGGESDVWVDDALKEAVNEDMVVVNLMETLGDQIREEEVTPGMQEERERGLFGSHEEETEYDEHVWLSVRNARILCRAIEEAIASADPEHAELYEANLNTYEEKIDALDKEYRAAVDAARVKTLVFGDRFPFRYLTDEYGLDYYAAFTGCSAETEASFETIRFLAGKVDELGLHAVCTIEGSDQEIAETIIRNTKTGDQEILTMNSMQSVTAEDAEDGASWISIMRDDLNVLREALQ